MTENNRSVTYDHQSFLVGGRRIWLAAGETHYFRNTPDLWGDMLWRIKRAGLNTVSTYIAWNRHEPREGAFDFSGDLDLGRYLDLAHEIGLYVFARPGPYICSEWTGGGLPGWLHAKPGIFLRENNPVYMDAVKAYWDRLIPIIAERQVDCGGSVILVQSENEYRHLYCPERCDYIMQLDQWLKDYGITVPITGCNAHSHDGKTISFFGGDQDVSPVPDQIQTYNTGLDARPLEDLRRKQPQTPLFTTEQWCGPLMHWGREVNNWPARHQHAAAVTGMLARGSMVNYYMFEGGTNFGHNGGQWFAAGYGSAYPVGEAGVLQEKYWALKPVNHLQQCLAAWLASSETEEVHRWTIPEGVSVSVRRAEQGAILFVDGRSYENRTCLLQHPEYGDLLLNMGASPHAILPLGFNVFGKHNIEYSNASLLWTDEASQTIFLYAPAGSTVSLSVSGEELTAQVTLREPMMLESRTGLQVILLDEDTACRFWPMEDGSIRIGAYYVEPDGTCVRDHAVPLYNFVGGRLETPSGAVRERIKNRTVPLPEWKNWTAEEFGADVPGQSIDRPCPHEQLGVYEGGVWYHARLQASEPGWKNLLIPSYGAGLVSVYHNGEYVGVLGEYRTRERPNLMERPRDQWREQLMVYLAKGNNEFLIYSEDMGRPAGGTPAPRGLSGNVYAGARVVQPEALADLDDAPVSDAAFHYLRYLDFPAAKPTTAVEFDLQAEAGEKLYLCFMLPLLDLFADCFAVPTFAVEVEGEVLEPVGLPSCETNAFEIPAPTAGGKVRVRVLYQGARQVLMKAMAAWGCPDHAKLTDWSWSAFKPPKAVPREADTLSTTEAAESRLLFPVSLDSKVETRGIRPTWYAASFNHPGEGRHFLRIGKLAKGQMYLNGHHVCRYWQKLPAAQTLYYLPTAWMKKENRLTIFEETGSPPVNVALVSRDVT